MPQPNHVDIPRAMDPLEKARHRPPLLASAGLGSGNSLNAFLSIADTTRTPQSATILAPNAQDLRALSHQAAAFLRKRTDILDQAARHFRGVADNLAAVFTHQAERAGRLIRMALRAHSLCTSRATSQRFQQKSKRPGATSMTGRVHLKNNFFECSAGHSTK